MQKWLPLGSLWAPFWHPWHAFGLSLVGFTWSSLWLPLASPVAPNFDVLRTHAHTVLVSQHGGTDYKRPSDRCRCRTRVSLQKAGAEQKEGRSRSGGLVQGGQVGASVCGGVGSWGCHVEPAGGRSRWLGRFGHLWANFFLNGFPNSNVDPMWSPFGFSFLAFWSQQ